MQFRVCLLDQGDPELIISLALAEYQLVVSLEYGKSIVDNYISPLLIL